MSILYRQNIAYHFPIILCFIIALLMLVRPEPSFSGQIRDITFGVFPYLPASRIQVRYTPVAEEISQLLHTPVHLKTRVSFKNFRESIKKEEYDIIFIQPFDYIRTASPHGYVAIARVAGELSAVFVTREDSPVKTLADVKGKIIAMPPRDAAVSLLAIKLLRDNRIDLKSDVRISYQRNHFACMKQVVISKADVCVTATVPRKMFHRRSGVTLHTLVTTKSIPASLFAVSKRIALDTRRSIIAMMADWSSSIEGRRILSGLQFSAVIRADDHTYDGVRAIWDELNDKML